MLHKIKFLMFPLIMLSFAQHSKASLRDQYCKLSPPQIGTVANRIHQRSKDDNVDFPMSSVIQSSFSGSFSSKPDQNNLDSTLEGFVRVAKGGQFSILPLSIPLFAVDLNPERDIIYVCAHLDPDKSKFFFEAYFLTGYRLGDITVRSFLGDALFNSVSVSPVVVNPVSFDSASNFFGGESDSDFLSVLLTPIRIPFEIASQAQSILMSSLKIVFPVGIERVMLTSDQVILYSDVNLNHPDSGSVTINIQLKQQ